MQISLNQAEIEQAIEDYINNQLTINDTQEVKIDLKATRGPEGFQAFIEIIDKTKNKQSTDKVTSEPKSKNNSSNNSEAKPIGEVLTPEESPLIPAKTEPKLNLVGEPVETAKKDTATNDEESDVVFEEKPKEVEAAPVSEKPVNSLFGGLRKPQND